MAKSLAGAGDPLALVDNQLAILRPEGTFRPFEAALAESGLFPLRPTRLAVFQMNLGRMCNQACRHCHVDAGPDRREIMTRATMEQCLVAIDRAEPEVVDLTGGAPEMNPDFRWLVDQLRSRDLAVMDRCNLTILLAPHYEDLAEFLASRAVRIVASLPYYTEANTDRQRGEGVFEKSIAALRLLNRLGYGQPDSPLELSLVYNPVGAFLPPAQAELERTFRTQLGDRFGVVFHRLLAIANQPINRFLDFLQKSGNYEAYMERLVAAYNPQAAAGVMCRDTISVGWDGWLFDCDFNQMLDLQLAAPAPRHVRAFDPQALAERGIVTGLHCYACTAGQGSSCGGATV